MLIASSGWEFVSELNKISLFRGNALISALLPVNSINDEHGNRASSCLSHSRMPADRVECNRIHSELRGTTFSYTFVVHSRFYDYHVSPQRLSCCAVLHYRARRVRNFLPSAISIDCTSIKMPAADGFE